MKQKYKEKHKCKMSGTRSKKKKNFPVYVEKSKSIQTDESHESHVKSKTVSYKINLKDKTITTNHINVPPPPHRPPSPPPPPPPYLPQVTMMVKQWRSYTKNLRKLLTRKSCNFTL